ncbi:MAG: hypothetical protein ACI9VR_001826 [Cognaticolwellia sp.]
MYSQIQMVAHYRENRADAEALLELYQGTKTELQARGEELRKVRGAAFIALAKTYLPTLDEGGLSRAEMLTGFRGFSRRSPLVALSKEVSGRKKRVAAILADDRYRRRQFLVGDHGELQTKMAEAQSMLEPWEHEGARYEDLPGFVALIDNAYDTPRFSLSFLSAQYWRLWKQGDAVCEALGVGDFGDDVLPAYGEVVTKRQQWRDVVSTIQGNIDAVHALVQEHDRCLVEIPILPARILAQSQEGLAEHLMHADVALLQDWLGVPPDRAIQLGLRRAAGISAKLAFLDEAVDKGLDGFLTELKERSSKFARKRQKYERSKNWGVQFGPEAQDLKFGLKVPKYRAEHLKLQNQLERMMAFQEYDSFSLDQDPEMWWWHMTGKSPSRYLPSTRGYYQRIPKTRLPKRVGAPTEKLSQAVSAAVASQELDVDYLS